MAHYPNKRKYTTRSAWRWKTFPLFGYHVVKYGRGSSYRRTSWHLSKYRAMYMARELYRHDLALYRESSK